MKITLIELDLWYSTVTHQSVLTSISNFFFSSEVATIYQLDSTAHKLKPRSFHKFAHLQANSVNFHPQCELYLTFLQQISESTIGISPNLFLIILVQVQ